MERWEMIEKLHDQAGISYEDANDALQRADFDMLEALQLLEREGKIKPLTSSMTTVEDDGYEKVTPTASSGNAGRSGRKAKKNSGDIERFFDNILSYCLVIKKKDTVYLNLPVVFAALICISAFEVCAALFIIALLCGCSCAVRQNGGEAKDKK